MTKKIQWWSDQKNLQLANVVNVMLYRHILPLQLWATPLWEHKSEDVRPVHHFFHSTLARMWTRIFKPFEDDFPSEGGDLSFEAGHDTPLVIFNAQVLHFCISPSVKDLD